MKKWHLITVEVRYPAPKLGFDLLNDYLNQGYEPWHISERDYQGYLILTYHLKKESE